MRRDRFITRTVLHTRKIFATFICNYFQTCHNLTMTVEDHSQIHRKYCQITNRDMPLTMSLHYAWNAWKVNGWGESELELVVNHIKNLIKQDRRRPESFRFNLLIMDTERFQQDLSEARSFARAPKPTFKDRVMEGRPKQGVKETVRTAGSFVKDPEGLKALLALRDSL